MELEKENDEFFRLKNLLGEKAKEPGFKRCFKCNRVKPLSEFGINSKKYQRPEAKGRNFKCKECV